MSLIIGTDSYVTETEATEYINKYYLSTDPLRISWESAGSEDKEIYLRNACQQIESLPFRGVKKDRNQILSFPRKDGNMQKVKAAQIVQAVLLTDTVQNEETNLRKRLQQSGVTSYRIGNLAETFKASYRSSLANVSTEVLNILKDYISGGYKICT